MNSSKTYITIDNGMNIIQLGETSFDSEHESISVIPYGDFDDVQETMVLREILISIQSKISKLTYDSKLDNTEELQLKRTIICEGLDYMYMLTYILDYEHKRKLDDAKRDFPRKPFITDVSYIVSCTSEGYRKYTIASYYYMEKFVAIINYLKEDCEFIQIIDLMIDDLEQQGNELEAKANLECLNRLKELLSGDQSHL